MPEGDEPGRPPPGWPVLVTGAGGFVGGRVAQALIEAGYRVRALSRRVPEVSTWEWVVGDLRNEADRRRALEGMRGVVHCAGWVRLGVDHRGEGRTTNVEATRSLVAEAAQAGVERLIYTSTLWTTAAGSASHPADENSPWNLNPIQSPYAQTKREAERLVLNASSPEMRTLALCPSMVIGPGDVRGTSTRVLLALARAPVAMLPGGGIPIIDPRVLARAHVRALEVGEPGRRYVVAGPYLSYRELAALVARVAGRPHRVFTLPDLLERPMVGAARWLDQMARGRFAEIAGAAVAGGFLRLHTSGARADAAFGLSHPPPIRSIFEALDDWQRSGRAPWLRLRPLAEDGPVALAASGASGYDPGRGMIGPPD